MSLANLLKQVQAKDWVSPELDRALVGTRTGNAWGNPKVHIRPSQQSACARAIQIGMLGYSEGFTAKSLRRMNNGTAAHDRWNGEFEGAGILHEANVRLKTEEPFWSGECDLIIKHPETGRLHIAELKTMNSFRWKGIPDQDKDPNMMARRLLINERAYMYQLTQYIVQFEKHLGTDATGIFLFENTDTQEYKVRFVRPDERMREDAFREPLAAQQASMMGELLPPPFKRASANCRRCYKENVCYRLQDGNPVDTAAVNKALESVKVAIFDLESEDDDRFGELEFTEI